MLNVIVAGLALAIWIYLLVGRGGFWLGRERDGGLPPAPAIWPAVAAVIPARNEAEGVGASVGSLRRQDYPGAFTLILVDDDSQDGTADVARRAAEQAGGPHGFAVLRGEPLPAGWTGKLWAVRQGIAAAEALPARPEYLLLTDADIAHDADTLRWLVSHAQAHRLVLTSFMAKLRCESFAERLHVPAFIFFFQMLYPFAWVNRPQAATAAAAGGCMLVRADALDAAGGIAAIRGALIDDCALGAALKAQGLIWLGLTERSRSIRPYAGFGELRRMVSRSAYAQLRYSPPLLAGTVVGLALTYLAAPLLAIFAQGPARWMGLAAWALMALAFAPTLRFYRLSVLWGPALPAIALLYLGYTLDSAWQYARGRGGVWKGRTQANMAGR